MRVFWGLEGLAGLERGAVAAVGTFDGAHLGHRAVFSRASVLAAARGAFPMVLTFDTHPVSLLRPSDGPAPLMTLDDRLAAASRLGMEAAVVLPFDDRISRLEPEGFAHEILAERIGVSAVVVGETWRFGRDRRGDLDLLSGLGARLGFTVEGVPSVLAGGRPVSSTRIRECLGRGEVEDARVLLGRPPFVRGTVVAGAGIGRSLGFPTLNLDCGDLLLPAIGVYAGACDCGPYRGPAAVNVGRRPSFGDGPPFLEAHLPGFDGDLYGRTATVALLARLREERRFPNRTELAAQIQRDVAAALARYEPGALEEAGA